MVAPSVGTLDHGITHFDLANGYGPPAGSAEQFMGRMLANDFAGYRNQLVISTKAGFEMWPGPYGQLGSKKYLIASLDESLERMGLDYVDIFYSHRPDYDTPFEETMGALVQAVHSGKALYVGLSNYRTEFAEEAINILENEGVRCLIHQPPYNIFNRWVLEEGFMPMLDAHGTGCITFSPLAQGLLTNKYLDGIPADSRAAKSHGYLQENDVDEATITAIKALHEIAEARGQSLAQMAVAWNLRHPGMTSVIIGASRTGQIDDNIGALSQPRVERGRTADNRRHLRCTHRCSGSLIPGPPCIECCMEASPCR